MVLMELRGFLTSCATLDASWPNEESFSDSYILRSSSSLRWISFAFSMATAVWLARANIISRSSGENRSPVPFPPKLKKPISRSSLRMGTDRWIPSAVNASARS